MHEINVENRNNNVKSNEKITTRRVNNEKREIMNKLNFCFPINETIFCSLPNKSPNRRVNNDLTKARIHFSNNKQPKI